MAGCRMPVWPVATSSLLPRTERRSPYPVGVMGRSTLWRAATLGTWAATAVVATLQVRQAWGIHYVGEDLWPLRGAAKAVLHGTDVYGVKNFVYPPTAAIASIPLTALPLHGLVRGLVVVQVIALAVLAAGSVLVMVPSAAGRRWRFALAGVAASVVLGGVTTYRALPLINISVLVALVALGLVYLWGRRHWGWAAVVLAGSLLIKPLLLPLVAVPLLARRVRSAAVTIAITAAGVLICLPIISGTDRLGAVASKLASGGILVGRPWARNNLSIAGLATMQSLPHDTAFLARAVVVCLAIAACGIVLRQRTWDTPRVAWLSLLILSGVFLASRLSEVHFLFALVPGTVAVLARSKSISARVTAAIGAAALCLPYWHITLLQQQELSILGESLLFVAGAAATVHAALAERRVVSQPVTVPRAGSLAA